MVWPLIAQGNLSVGGWISICETSLNVQKNLEFFIVKIGYSWRQSTVTDGGCKGNVSCTPYSRTFTIHKWLRQTAYILTHNLNMLEHIANNGMNTTTHTDANIAQFWARRAPSVDAHVFIHRTCGSSLVLCVIPCHPCMRTCVLLLEWFLLTRLSTSSSSSSSSSTWCPSRRLMRSPWKIPCATPAWGAWSLWTMSHPSHSQLDSEDREPPSATCTSKWSSRALNLFSNESQDAIKAAGNTELCEIVDVEPKALCRACLTYWDVGIVYCTCGHFLKDGTTEYKKYIKSVLSRTFTSGKAGHTVTGTGRKKVAKNTTRQINSIRSVERNDTRTFTIDLSVIYGSERLWSNWVALKK